MPGTEFGVMNTSKLLLCMVILISEIILGTLVKSIDQSGGIETEMDNGG